MELWERIVDDEKIFEIAQTLFENLAFGLFPQVS